MMKTTYSLTFAIAAIFLGGLFFSGCGKDAPVVQDVRSITIHPATLALEVGATAQFAITVEPKEATVGYSIDHPDIIGREGMTIKALKVGEATLTANAGSKSATLKVVVTEKVAPESFFLPYLRFFDGKDATLKYEKSIGHILQSEDPSMNSITFSTGSAKVPSVTYIVGVSTQMYASKEVMQSREFIDFMASKGFKTNEEIKQGVMEYTSDLKTVRAFAIADTIELADGTVFPMGMCFSSIPPLLPEIPYPLIKWDATLDELKAFESGRGYTINPETTDAQGRVTYTFSKKDEMPEYTQLFAPKYLFQGGKLIKITLIIAPDEYVLRALGGAISVYKEFVSLAKRDGFVEKPIPSSSRKVYINEVKRQKFTIESWTINLNGHKAQAAGLAFVPFDGPEVVE